MAQTNKTSIRILIVDDTAPVRQDLKTILPIMADRARVTLEIVGEAEDGQEAIRLAARMKPDVVLMDLAMPGMNGFLATQEIKAANPGARVVILSVYGDSESRKKAKLAGADDFIEKGAPLECIFQAVAGDKNR
jgi:DNA-binding NarL/FixJ family response regulator